MLKKQYSYLDVTLETYRVMIEYSQPQFYKVETGYGITASGFDDQIEENGKMKKLHKTSEKKFRDRLKKEKLLEIKHVRIIKSNERGKFYSITPLGIAWYCKHISDFDLELTKIIFKHLRFYYYKEKPKKEVSYFDKVEELNLLNDYFLGALDEVLRWIEQTPRFEAKKEPLLTDSAFTSIELLYELPHRLKILFADFLIFSKGIKVRHTFNENSGSQYEKIDENRMYYLISKYLIKASIHSLVTVLSGFDIRTSLDPEEDKEEFEKFSEEIIGVANEFNDQLLKSMKIYQKPLNHMKNEIENRISEITIVTKGTKIKN